MVWWVRRKPGLGYEVSFALYCATVSITLEWVISVTHAS